MSRLTPWSAVCSAVLLAACASSSVETSGGGVGFQDYNSYIRGAQPAPLSSGPVVVPPVGGAFDPAAAAAAIDRADGALAPGAVVAPGATAAVLPPADGAARPRGGAPEGIKEEAGEVSNVGISDEQDFGAVSSRETIESDAERIAKNRADYVVVQPTDVPQRPGDTGANIVEFALSTNHAPGVQIYKRGGIGLRGQDAACAKYSSPDQAQQDFLERGGPDRDRLGVDPDGDGFACSWDPRPFRTALQ